MNNISYNIYLLTKFDYVGEPAKRYSVLNWQNNNITTFSTPSFSSLTSASSTITIYFKEAIKILCLSWAQSHRQCTRTIQGLKACANHLVQTAQIGGRGHLFVDISQYYVSRRFVCVTAAKLELLQAWDSGWTVWADTKRGNTTTSLNQRQESSNGLGWSESIRGRNFQDGVFQPRDLTCETIEHYTINGCEWSSRLSISIMNTK